ncbi:MAG: RICIN domain-containing protein [Ruminococcus sp.]|nr:RICIN domain-containing protein [Ruminococcus sp.]
MKLLQRITGIVTAGAAMFSVLAAGTLPAGTQNLTAEAAANYPVQELRFGIGDTNRSFCISDTADGSYVSSLSELDAGTVNCKWSLNYISAGVYEIVSSATGYVLTDKNGLVVIAPDTDASNQRWQISAVQQDSEGYDLYYKIVSNADTNAALTFDADSNSVMLQNYSGDLYQKFKLNLDGLQGYAANCVVDGQEKAGTIGGLLGETVFVDTDDELKAAMLKTEPLTIVLTKDLDWHPYGQQEIRSHKTLVGAYGVTLKDAQIRTCPNDTDSSDPPSDNLVFRNLRLLAKDSTNCMLFNIYSSRQIWIDHCSFISELPRAKDEVGKFIWCNSPFGGTWKSRATDFMTISYCYFYNRYWTTLFASVSYEVPSNEKIRCRVSFLYCFYDQCVRRCPQLGSAYGHIVCGFWRGKSASETDGIDQIIGGGQTDVVSQNCRFEAVASGHELCAGGGSEPYRDDGSYTAADANSTPSAINFSPKVTSTRHPENENYGFSLINAVGTYNTKDFCVKYSGSAASEDALKYITDSDLADWISITYPSPFLKDIPVGNEPVTGLSAEMDTKHVYSFINAGSGHYLEVADSREENGANVQQGNTGASAWTLEDEGEGYYRICSTLGDGKTYYLGLENASADNGANVAVWSDAENDGQVFKFLANRDGTYTIVSKVTEGKSAIGIAGGSVDAGANAMQWVCDGTDNQKWIAAINGNLIRHMQVTDSTKASWSIDTEAAVDDMVYGDRDNAAYATIPETLIGAEMIVTACDAKNSAEDLASFVAGADMTVYVALDARVSTVPGWLSSWTMTDMTVTSSRGVTYNLYSLACKAGDAVTLGTNGQVSGCVNYTVFAVKTGEEEPETVQGDVNADGTFSVADLVMMQKYLLNLGGLTDLEAGDVYQDNRIQVLDLVWMKQMLHAMTK